MGVLPEDRILAGFYCFNANISLSFQGMKTLSAHTMYPVVNSGLRLSFIHVVHVSPLNEWFLSLRSKRFRGFREQRKSEKRDIRCFARPIFRAGKTPKIPFLGLSLLPNSKQTLANACKRLLRRLMIALLVFLARKDPGASPISSVLDQHSVVPQKINQRPVRPRFLDHLSS